MYVCVVIVRNEDIQNKPLLCLITHTVMDSTATELAGALVSQLDKYVYMGEYLYRLTGVHQDRGSQTAACGDCGCTGVGEINVCADAFESTFQVFYSVSNPGGT